jgi:N-acetyl-beta-hexosaminidase
LCFDFQKTLQDYANVAWEIVAGKHVPAAQIGVALSVTPGAVAHPQGYALTITPTGIDVVASEPAGVFYAVQTLRQILQQRGRSLPALRCSDQPARYFNFTLRMAA